MPSPHVVLVCGSRKWTDPEPIRKALQWLPEGSVIIHGGAAGADSLAGLVAESLGHHVAVIKANWLRHGKSAGPKRNAAMALLRPERVYAFDLGGPGTADMCRKAEQAGIPVARYGADV